MELILHIGSPKTGSTSLQWAFHNNRDLLSKEGIYCPLSKKAGRYGAELYNNIVAEIMNQILGVDEKLQTKLNKDVEKSINALLYRSKKSSSNKILLSEEACFFNISYFVTRNEYISRQITETQFEEIKREAYKMVISKIRQRLNRFDIKIVCYLRGQDLYIESLYNQLCKTGEIKNILLRYRKYNNIFTTYNNKKSIGSSKNFEFNACCNYFYSDLYYYDKLNIWAEVFGRENIIVKPFEKGQFKQGLVKDFFIDVLGIEPTKLTNLREHYENERITRDVLEYLNSLEQWPKSCIDSDMIPISKKFEESEYYGGDYQDHFTLDERIKLLEYHEEGNKKIAQEYLQRGDGRLFYENIEMKESKPYPGLNPEKIKFLDEEFRILSEKKANLSLFEKLSHQLDKAATYAKLEVSIDNSGDFVKKIKIYYITATEFSKQIISILIGKVLQKWATTSNGKKQK